MKGYKIVPILLLLVLLLGLTTVGYATADEDSQVTLAVSAQSYQAQAGEEVSFQVMVEKNTGFAHMTMHVCYDPQALVYVSHELNGEFFAADCVADTSQEGTIVVTVDAWTEGNTLLNEGRLMTVTFRVNEAFAGTTQVTAMPQSLMNAQGEAITAYLGGGCDMECTTEHVHTEEVISASPATCTEPGWTEGVKCAECGEILTAPQYIAPNGHKEGPSVVENHVLPTCQADGSYELVVYCSVCNEELSRETVIDPSTGEHSYTIEQERLEPTCTEAGYVVWACVCSLTEQETLPATGHKEVVDAAVEPTCTETGLTEGSHCEVCGEVVVAQETVEALGHTPGEEVKENEVPVSCQSDGSYDRVVYCTVCQAEVSRKTIYIPSTGEHNYATEQERLEPTCTEDGHVIMACGCGDTQTETLPAIGHTEVVDPGVEATCTEPGLSDGTHCEVCGETVVAQEEVSAKGHTETTLHGYAATCTEPGLTDGTVCLECGIILVAQEQTPKAPHSEELLPGYAPTCTETGMTDGWICAICGQILVEQRERPMTDHTPVEVAEKAPTCAESGHTAGVMCESCGYVVSGCTTLQKLAHTEVVDAAVEPTCTETGLTEGRRCSVCGEITKKQTVIAKVDHTPEVISAVEPTCSEVGWTEGSRCAVCSEILEDPQQIDKVAHETITLDGKPATCTETGLTQGQQCNRCGAILEPQQEIPVLEHQYAHSCDPDCDICGAARVSLQHQFGNWNTVREATEESTGEEARSCQNCGHRETRITSRLVAKKTNQKLLLGIAYAVMAASAAGIVFVLHKRRKA